MIRDAGQLQEESMDYYDEQKRRASEWFGLRPSDAQPCPRVVAGKRCLAYHAEGRCICTRHDYPLFDHRRIWLDKAGRHVFTVEPYEADGEDVARLLRDLAELGLDATLYGHSPWNPGGTFLLLVHRRDVTIP